MRSAVLAERELGRGLEGIYPESMPDEWDLSDDEIDSWL